MDADELRAFVDATAHDARQSRKIAGLSIAVAQNGQLSYTGGFGYANVEKRILANAATVYGIGSLTKQFTAAAVMQLVEQGVIELDHSLSNYIPHHPDARTPVTIRHLLNHTAGISGEADLGMLQDGSIGAGFAREAVINLLEDGAFDSPPGHVWRYSNYGYYLLGLLIELVTGNKYTDHLREHVLARAGLLSTSHDQSEVHPQLLAQGYTDRGGHFATIKSPPLSQTFSSGTLYSSVEDLCRWQHAVSHGLVIQPESYEQMITPDVLDTGERLQYGYGFFLARCGEYREISHDGTTGGYSVQLANYPSAGLTVVVLTNSESHEAEGIEKRITRRMLGLQEVTLEDLALSSSRLASYAGTYLYKGLPIPVVVKSENLVVRTPGGKTVRLVYIGANRFRQEDDSSMQFEFTIQSQRADTFKVLREGKTLATVRRVS